jgi:hypothetical protein
VKRPGSRSSAVAGILALGVSLALIGLTGAAVYAVTTHSPDTFEAARLVAITQVLTGWGGGMIGVLGSYIGFTFGKHKSDNEGDQ